MGRSRTSSQHLLSSFYLLRLVVQKRRNRKVIQNKGLHDFFVSPFILCYSYLRRHRKGKGRTIMTIQYLISSCFMLAILIIFVPNCQVNCNTVE